MKMSCCLKSFALFRGFFNQLAPILELPRFMKKAKSSHSFSPLPLFQSRPVYLIQPSHSGPFLRKPTPAVPLDSRLKCICFTALYSFPAVFWLPQVPGSFKRRGFRCPTIVCSACHISLYNSLFHPRLVFRIWFVFKRASDATMFGSCLPHKPARLLVQLRPVFFVGFD